MRRLAFIVGIALVTGMIPVASANHFSAGYYDSLGTQPEETPSNEDKTVPASQFEIGTSRDCHDPSDDISAQEIQDTAEANGFCGMLIFHENDPVLEQESEPDQDLNAGIGTFDVVRAQTYGSGVGMCEPFCEEYQGQDNPTADPLFNATHDVGNALGLTDPPETAYEEENDRNNVYAVNTHINSPTGIIQSNTGFWEMNGWWWPAALSTFVAYIADDGGVPVDDEDLQGMVDTMKENEALNPNTEAAVCGYTPDFQFTSVGPDAPGLNCEFEFEYINTDRQSDPTDPTFDGYEDECETPTYVCGAQNGPAWYSQGCVCLGLADPKIPGSDPLPGPESTLAGPEGQTDYIRWHFVIAPHNSDCGGAQEPGFSFSPDGPYDHPYLAHDLDVWTTIASTSLHDAGASVPEYFDYADVVAERFTTPVGEAIGDPGSAIPDLPVPAETDNVVREPMLEPNNAEPIGEIDDTSRTFEDGTLDTDELFRDLTGACEQLFAQEEPETVDPWVDYVDSRAMALQDVDVTGTYATDERIIRHVGPYGTSADEHDGTNRPGPSFYATDGKIGMFTDKDDDGEYDQLEAGIKYNAQNTLGGGAYPMIWNMWADTSGSEPVPHEEEGCEISGKTMSQAAGELGYGVHTGLAQAIYLNEPTVFRNPGTTEVVPYAGGNNIYVLTSQAAGELWTSDDLTDEANPLDTEIDTLVSELKAYVEDDLGRDEPNVIVPADQTGVENGFDNQCTGPTGNFHSNLEFVHDCHAADCTGDTIATMYTFELTAGTLEGSENLPTFAPSEEGAYDFGATQHTWYDVDPFDNDPDRNEQGEESPPDPDAGPTGEGLSDELLE